MEDELTAENKRGVFSALLKWYTESTSFQGFEQGA